MELKRVNKKERGKGGCLMLMLAACVFIAAVYGVMILCMTMQDKSSAKENSLKQIDSCNQTEREGKDKIRDYFDNESCTELIKQHAAKFKNEP
ncbi:hypothetical protein [Pantoea coffeiphila]|uniref:hypothetical protein n=1 Tax=Pantoea coffeiphila TaxID=1465635 RepID=UPI0011B03E7E|nr:hypothetical protein [Pantoea coffeiphila]